MPPSTRPRLYNINQVTAVELKNGETIDVCANEDYQETKEMLDAVTMLDDPEIIDTEGFPMDMLQEGMKKEMSSMTTFNVFKEVKVTDLSQDDVRQALPTRWVHVYKGDGVRSRLVAKGCFEEAEDKSTPS